MMRVRVRSCPCGNLAPVFGCPGGGKRFAWGVTPGLPGLGVDGRPAEYGGRGWRAAFKRSAVTAIRVSSAVMGAQELNRLPFFDHFHCIFLWFL